MPFAVNIYYHLSPSNHPVRLPVVLIHGVGGSHLSWPPQVRRLPGFPVYALDLPGHGKSGGYGYQSISAFAQAIATWLDSIRFSRAVFVGHSMGGAVALTLAIDHAELTAGLVLIGSGARLRVAPELLEETSSPATVHKARDKILTWSFSSRASPSLVKLTAKRMAETRPSVLHGDLLACNAFDATDRLSLVNCPALILCGREDKMTPLKLSAYLGASIPGAALRVVPEAGHMLVLEEPEKSALIISEYLSGLM